MTVPDLSPGVLEAAREIMTAVAETLNEMNVAGGPHWADDTHVAAAAAIIQRAVAPVEAERDVLLREKSAASGKWDVAAALVRANDECEELEQERGAAERAARELCVAMLASHAALEEQIHAEQNPHSDRIAQKAADLILTARRLKRAALIEHAAYAPEAKQKEPQK